jgi:hypothetical protein
LTWVYLSQIGSVSYKLVRLESSLSDADEPASHNAHHAAKVGKYGQMNKNLGREQQHHLSATLDEALLFESYHGCREENLVLVEPFPYQHETERAYALLGNHNLFAGH